MRVFITGGTGLVGRRLVAKLRARGDDVYVLSRSAAKIQGLPEGTHIIQGDPTVAGPWLEILKDCDGVLHLAGEPILGKRWSAAFQEKILSSRVQSTTLITEKLAQHPLREDGSPKVFVSASAIGIYGASRASSEEFNEESPLGDDFLAGVCKAWEKASAPLVAAGVRRTTVRVGVVLAREGGALPKMLPPFKMFMGGPLAGGKQWFSWIHIEDMIGLFLLALDDARVQGALNGTAPEPLTNWGFCKMLGKALRRPSWFPVPGWVLRIVLGKGAVLVTQGQRVTPRKAILLNYDFQFPRIEEALADLLAPR